MLGILKFSPFGSTTGLLVRLTGQTSSLYLKPWPVCLFKDWPFSLHVVAASESDRGLVLIFILDKQLHKTGWNFLIVPIYTLTKYVTKEIRISAINSVVIGYSYS